MHDGQLSDRDIDPRAGRSRWWVAFAVVNALITFFGSSYIWFPGEAVVAAGYRTEGVAQVPSAWWGAFVMTSALAMLVVALSGLWPNRAWARRAALYEFLFLFLVVVIEPDPVFPTLFGVVLGVALWRLHRAAGGSGAAADDPSEALAG
jgi:hypothetical protein